MVNDKNIENKAHRNTGNITCIDIGAGGANLINVINEVIVAGSLRVC